MKSFKSYLKEYGVLNPAFAVGGSATGPGMGQYNPTSDLNLRASNNKKQDELLHLKLLNKAMKLGLPYGSPKAKQIRKELNTVRKRLGLEPIGEEKNPRIPRKKGQPAGSKKHSDLYTDENPKGTIHGLKFATVKDAEDSVRKIKNSGKTHAHKIQAAIAMEQRAREMGKISAADVYRAYINKMKKKTKEMQKEDFEPVNQGKLSELIFRGSMHGKDNDLYNMYLPMSSAMFKRVFPKEVRGTFFHVTDVEGFENLYDIQNSKKSIAAFANMSAKNIISGVASGSGVVVEIEANALAASADDLTSLPIRDGRRLISYRFFHDEFNKEKVKGMDRSMSVLLQAMIRKYALPSRVKKPRYSPYFSDFEVFKSIRNDYNNKKYDEMMTDKKTAGKRMQMLIKDYLNGIERILKKHAKGVQEALTGYLKRKATNRNWDEIIVDDVNITRIFIVSDHEETKIFKKDQLDHENYKKNLEYVGVPVEIRDSGYIEKYVAKVRDKSLKEDKEDEELAKTMRIATAKMQTAKRIRQVRQTQKARMDALTRAKASPDRKSSLKKDQEDQIKSIKRASDADIKQLQKNSFLERFTQSDVDGLEKFADRLLKKFKIDVEFTRHFVDRLNDPRNSPEIKIAELQRLFKKIKKNKGIGISSNPDIEAVLKDMETNLNLPVVIKKKGNEFELINKTIMRKPDFKTTSKVIRYENAPNTKDAMKRYRAGKAGFTDIAHLKAKGLIKRSDGTKKKSAKYEDTKCPPGYKFDKKLNACVPKGKVVYYAPFFGRMKDPTPSNGQDANNTGNGQNGNGTNGNGGNGNGGNGGNGQTGNGQSGGESYLVADVRKMPGGGYGVYADKFVKGKRVMTPGGKHKKELKKVYKNEKDANDYMAAIMIAKGGG